MAGKTGPENGAEAVPVEPTIRPEGELRPLGEEPRPSDDLSPGEPSWPEDAQALRTEALSEEGPGADARRVSEPGPEITSSDAGMARGVSDADDRLAMPGRAGPLWERDTPTGAPAFDPSRPSAEGDFAMTGLDSPAARSEAPGSAQPSPDLPPPSFAAPGGASAAMAPPPPRRRGIGALLLGGMIAAALGFGAAWVARDRLAPAELALPADVEERLAALEGRPAPDEADVGALADRLAEAELRLDAIEEAPAPVAAATDLEPLREEIATGLADAQARAAGLEDRLAALESRPAASATAPTAGEGPGPAVRATAAPVTANASGEADAALEPRLGEIEATLSTVREALSDVETALAALEERVGVNETALAALDQQVAGSAGALQAIDQRLAQAEAAGAAAVEEARTAAASLAEAQARATEAEAQALTGAALTALDAAIDRGEPLSVPLSEIEAAGIAVPASLAQAAAEGVPSLASLREEFPDAARAGLEAAREAGLVDDRGFWGFVRGQFSVRSTAPREGDDPDAILSRAEAALAGGRLDAALQEVQALPEPVRTAMADWIVRARARAEAEAALATLRGAEPDAAPAN